jgi:hypothetical protein
MEVSYALSSDVIKNKLKDYNIGTKIITYDKINNIKTIEELLYPYDNCFLLYKYTPIFGHWVLIFKNMDNKIEVFNSYGKYLPDDELKLIDKNFRIKSNQDKNYLCNLLYDYGKSIEYNHHNFQKYGENINTCGRWCILRLIYHDFKLDEFIEMFDGLTDEKLSKYL